MDSGSMMCTGFVTPLRSVRSLSRMLASKGRMFRRGISESHSSPRPSGFFARAMSTGISTLRRAGGVRQYSQADMSQMIASMDQR